MFLYDFVMVFRQWLGRIILCTYESRKQNPRDITLDLPFFFRLKHITSLKSHPSPAPSESLPYWSGAAFAAMFVLNYWLKEFPLSAFSNRFELRCQLKQLLLLYYEICPC